MKRQRIAITGSNGLIGTALKEHFAKHTILPIVRHAASAECIHWDPYAKKIESNKLEGADVVIHLSGESIAQRWTNKKREEIRASRVQTTRYLCNQLAELKNKPKVLICASAIGIYPSGDHITETTLPTTSFLADVVQQWEAATRVAQKAGIRVVHMRLGVILSAKGGALKKMLPLFKVGLGGMLGDGMQHMSWISIEDVVRAVEHCIHTRIKGPVNFTAPESVTNRTFTKALSKQLHRPAFFHVPAFVLKSVFGEMAQHTVLLSQRVIPRRLLDSEFEFTHDNLDEALHDLLK